MQLVSGSIFGGVSTNKITAIAGESSTGKTFFSLAVVKNFLDSNPDGYCLYFDKNPQLIKDYLSLRGIDLRFKSFVVVNVVTIEEFRTKALKAVDKYLQMPIDERKPCMFVLDSLGMLSTEKEIRDALDDKQVRDMTKSQLVKGAFRMLTLKLGQANVPLIVTNHTYDVIGVMFQLKKWEEVLDSSTQRVQSFISERKRRRMEKKSLETLSKRRQHKSRLSKENKQVEIRLSMMNVVLISIMVFLNWERLEECGRMLQITDMRLMEKGYMLNRSMKNPKNILLQRSYKH